MAMEVREQLAMALDKARPIHIEDYNDFVLYDAVFNAYSYLIEDPNDHHLENRFKVRLQLEEALGENYYDKVQWWASISI